MADSEKSGSGKLDVGLGRVGVPLQSVTLATLVIGGWQARGYLEEQIRAMDAMRASIEEIRHDGMATRTDASKLADAITEASRKMEELKKRIEKNAACLEERRKNPRAECDT